MKFSNLRSYLKPPHQSGFSLIELLVIVSILAAVSLIAVTSYRGVAEDSDKRLVLIEMQEIAQAIRQFKQDTGYYPKQGPFGLAIDGLGGEVVDDGLPDFVKDYPTDAKKSLWFNSPANFYQLLTNTSPLSGITPSHQLEEWDTETGRGWRGPYLRDYWDGYVDIGSEINEDIVAPINVDPEGIEGDPLEITLSDPSVPDVYGIADPFNARHEPVPTDVATDGTLLDWSRDHRPSVSDSGPDRADIDYWGRPYLYFLEDKDNKPHIQLISMGPDGEYDDGEASSVDDPDYDNITLTLEIN